MNGVEVYADAEDCPIRIVREETAYHGSFSNLTVVHFLTRSGAVGVSSKFASPSLQTKQYNSTNADGTNGVHVIARLKNDNRSYFVFIKQYRIPSRSWTLEFPGGYHSDSSTFENHGFYALMTHIRAIFTTTDFPMIVIRMTFLSGVKNEFSQSDD
ncbi:unnamed protein product [Heligmosomoides polygyrus]|uniref:CIA30 domain-containing protein n=1 Tax=Heligmosomoides polygyrus TaxID=6339 RepID=A0A183GAL4_HELPZ|nr:unnamed protein product [Heligmosomoides polygyrus]